MLPKRKRPLEEEDEELDDEEPVDLAILMGGEQPPMGDEEDDEYSDDELAEGEMGEEGAAPAAVSPELLSYFETFDDPDAPTEERAAALQSFIKGCGRQKMY